MVKIIAFSFVAFALIYFLFYPFLKNKVNRRKLFNWFIVAYLIALAISTAATYLR